MLDFVAFGLESGHDAPVCGYSMAVVAGLEGFHKNGVGVTVVGQHDVLVATARACGESAHVVCVELADGLYKHVEFVCSRGGGIDGGSYGFCRFGFGGSEALSGLGKVPLEGFRAVGAVLGGVGKSEARPAGVVAGFDGGEPSGFDREAGCGVEVVHEGAYAGEVACVECKMRGCGKGRREDGWLWMVVR
mgnify:CR=1 FL=1